MALIKPIHGEMKGSIGGNTWQGGKFGQVVRQRRKPVNPNSEKQAARRQLLALLNTFWKALSQTEKEEYDEYSQNTPMKNKFGDPVHITGRQMFIRLNAFTVGGGGSVLSSAPNTPGMAPNPDFTLVSDTASDLSVGNFDLGGGSDDIIQFQFAGPFASSKQMHKGPWRDVAYTTSDGTDPLVLIPGAELVVGQIYFVACRRADNVGRLSEQFMIKRVETTFTP